jgi:hypothetical protein
MLKEEGRGKKEEGRGEKEEGRRKRGEGSYAERRLVPRKRAGTPLGEALPRQAEGKQLPPSIPRQSWGNELKSRGTSLQITSPEPNKTRWRPLELLRVVMLHPSLVRPEFPYKKSKC